MKKKGFTLIELIVVIAILGILAAIAIPRLSGFQKNAKYRADVSTARVVATAASTFYAADPTKNYIGTSPAIVATDTVLWTTTAFTDLLPSNMATSHKTQYDPSSSFTVTISSTGDVTVTAGSTTLYPNPSGTAPTAATY